MRARYYSPDLKRFVYQDVLVGAISDSQSLNRYAYTNGNPIFMEEDLKSTLNGQFFGI
jgi:RHS repeat-associated protein